MNYSWAPPHSIGVAALRTGPGLHRSIDLSPPSNSLSFAPDSRPIRPRACQLPPPRPVTPYPLQGTRPASVWIDREDELESRHTAAGVSQTISATLPTWLLEARTAVHLQLHRLVQRFVWDQSQRLVQFESDLEELEGGQIEALSQDFAPLEQMRGRHGSLEGPSYREFLFTGDRSIGSDEVHIRYDSTTSDDVDDLPRYEDDVAPPSYEDILSSQAC